MADKKISQLTTLAQADVAVTADFLPIVDTSATETKKATPQALVQAGATGATLPVALGAVGTPSYTFTGDLNTGLWSPAADTLAASTGGSERLRVDSSGNLGIGTASPVARLDVQAALLDIVGVSTTGTNYVRQRMTNTGGDFYYGIDGSAGANFGVNYGAVLWYTGAYPMVFATNNTERMRLDASGNLGIGTTPSAWRSGATALQVGGFVSLWTQASGSVNLAFNAYESAANTFAYRTTGDAPTIYSQVGGVHTWSNAVAGTAGNTFSFTERMRLDASGNLGIGTASPTSRLFVQTSGGTGVTGNFYSPSTTNGAGIRLADNNNNWTIKTLPSGGATSLVFSYDTDSTERFRIDSNGNTIAGNQAALATNATNGFLYVPTCAGTPTGTPTAITGMAPIIVDTTNNKLYFYSGGAWRDAGP